MNTPEEQGQEAASLPDDQAAETVPKPSIPDMPPEEGHDPPTDQEEHEVEPDAPMEPSEAEADDTVDNREVEDAPENGDEG